MEPKPHTLQILLADDDTDDCSFFAEALKEIPIATFLTTVRNGEELMKHLYNTANDLPHVLFLDLSMPRKTGFECLSEIKGSELFKNIPVIMFTTSVSRGINFEQSIIKTLTMMGALDYIRKPAGFEQLKQVIHNALTLVTTKISETETPKSS